MATGPPRRLKLELLDDFRLLSGDEAIHLPHSAQRVLAYLALHRAHARVHLAAALWPEATTDRARGNLRSVLWRLGLLHAPQVLLAGEDEIALADDVEVDVDAVRALAESVLRGDAPPGVSPRQLAGDLLPDWDEDWVLIERERFRHVRLHALERLSEQLAGAGRHGEAVEAALQALAGDGLRESAHRALISAYLAEGNRGEALRQYRTCHRLLSANLGLRPSAQLEELIARTLAWP